MGRGIETSRRFAGGPGRPGGIRLGTRCPVHLRGGATRPTSEPGKSKTSRPATLGDCRPRIGTPRPPCNPRHVRVAFGLYRILPVHPTVPGPSIRFLFVGAATRLRLPSDPASRRTPLPLAIRFGATSVRWRLSLQTRGMPGTQKKGPALRPDPPLDCTQVRRLKR